MAHQLCGYTLTSLIGSNYTVTTLNDSNNYTAKLYLHT